MSATVSQPPEAQNTASPEQWKLAADLYLGISSDVWAERHRQLLKWGFQSRPNGTNQPDDARRLQLARQDYDIAVAGDVLCWRHILAEEFFEALAEDDVKLLREELVQVMAVAASWIQDIDIKSSKYNEE